MSKEISCAKDKQAIAFIRKRKKKRLIIKGLLAATIAVVALHIIAFFIVAFLIFVKIISNIM